MVTASKEGSLFDELNYLVTMAILLLKAWGWELDTKSIDIELN